MAINPSSILQYIEMSLGASLQVLELTVDEIMDIINTQSIPTFSLYYPYLKLIEINSKEDAVPGRFNTFYIKTDLEIVGVSKLLAENYMGISGVPMSMYDSDPINRQITADITSMYIQPLTFAYETPNIVSVFPKTMLLGKFAVEIKTVHPTHMATINRNLIGEFKKLCLYDIQIALYPIRQRFATINTTFGSIELFMEGLQEATNNRSELLDKWRENFFKNSRKRKIYLG